jgi:hypothetical protein
VLQALGCFDEPSPARLAVLRGAEADPDPLLRFYAVKALLGLEQPVSDATLARVASVDRTRAWLVALLQRRRELERLPHDARTQEALARSHLVGWLAHPLELGRPPAAIETMGTVARPEGVFYVFRYRPRPGHAWLAGVAGPYAAGEITAESPDDVFSELRPASLATPAEHVASTLRTLRDWRESADD